MLENAGRDTTVPFMEVGHSKDALAMLKKYEVGMLVEVGHASFTFLSKLEINLPLEREFTLGN